jgi:hypothetical protein
MNMTDRDPALEPFDALIGTWATEATHPMLPCVVVPGSITFEWLQGGRFLVRARATSMSCSLTRSASSVPLSGGGCST